MSLNGTPEASSASENLLSSMKERCQYSGTKAVLSGHRLLSRVFCSLKTALPNQQYWPWGLKNTSSAFPTFHQSHFPASKGRHFHIIRAQEVGACPEILCALNVNILWTGIFSRQMRNHRRIEGVFISWGFTSCTVPGAFNGLHLTLQKSQDRTSQEV